MTNESDANHLPRKPESDLCILLALRDSADAPSTVRWRLNWRRESWSSVADGRSLTGSGSANVQIGVLYYP